MFVCLLTALSICSNRLFSTRVKSIVRGGKRQLSTLIFSRLVSFSGQKGMADWIWSNIWIKWSMEDNLIEYYRKSRLRLWPAFIINLFWLSLSPVVLPLFTHEDAVLGSVDHSVKRNKSHNAGQTETACIYPHTNLRSDRCDTNTQIRDSPKNNLCLSNRQMSLQKFHPF